MPAESGPDAEDREELVALATRLKAAIAAAGGNKRVAEASGVALRTLNAYVAADVDPKITKLGRIAEACGVSLDELLGRKLQPSSADIGTAALDSRGELVGFVPVPRLEIRASAGRGIIPTGGGGEDMMLFREAWLRSMGIAPRNAEVLQAEGDSMDPTIKDGDLMLVDRGFGEVQNGKIYVLVVEGAVLVKRVQRLAFGGLMLISDNDRYPSETIPAAEVGRLSIEARVACYWRAM